MGDDEAFYWVAAPLMCSALVIVMCVLGFLSRVMTRAQWLAVVAIDAIMTGGVAAHTFLEEGRVADLEVGCLLALVCMCSALIAGRVSLGLDRCSGKRDGPRGARRGGEVKGDRDPETGRDEDEGKSSDGEEPESAGEEGGTTDGTDREERTWLNGPDGRRPIPYSDVSSVDEGQGIPATTPRLGHAWDRDKGQ